MKKGIVALAAGTFALGMAEYVMMSILPDLARDFNVSITEAGHLISAYALGVCVGAPLVAIFMRNMPLRLILLILIGVYLAGNLMFATAHSFSTGLIARFISGLPHGAYFGTGTIVASRLMPDKQATGVALMVLGMTVANLAGIPLGSFIANSFDWRWIFFFNAAFGAVTILMIRLLIPRQAPLPHTHIKESFMFMKKREPWVLTAATLFCQGGAFAMYSYVSPVMNHAGLVQAHIPVFMIIVGAGMCVGNYLGGSLSDRFSPSVVAKWVAITMTLALIATYFDSFSMLLTGTSVLLVATCLFALSSPMQLLLVENSPGGQLMGGAMVQVAFNLGNAIGAFAGGLPIAAGYQPQSSAIVGAALSFISIGIMIYFIKRAGQVAK